MTVVAIALVALGMVLVGALAFADPVLLSWFEREKKAEVVESPEFRAKEKQRAAQPIRSTA